MVAIMTVELDLCSLLCTPVLHNTTIDWKRGSTTASWEGTEMDDYAQKVLVSPSAVVNDRELEPAQLLAVMVME